MRNAENIISSNKRFSMKIKLIFLTIIMIVLPSCNCKCDEGETAESIIRNYYKNKQIGSKSLSEEQRVLLDSVVLKLEETGEPRSVIQYVVNEYKLKYGK